MNTLKKHNDIIPELPKVIYKYRDWENLNHKKIITEQELYFPNFSQLNDEFDGKHPFRFNNAISFSEYKDGLKSSHFKEFNKLTSMDLLKMYEDFKSGKDWKDYHSDHIKFINNNFGVYSFAKTNNNEQLWANYANSNKGFCIGFDSLRLLKNIRGTMGYVNYNDNPITLSFPHTKVEEYQSLFFTKKKNWKYEEEIRILKTFASEKLFNIDKKIIKEIIFGFKMKQEHRMEIIQKVNFFKLKEVSFFEISKQIEDSTFKIIPLKK